MAWLLASITDVRMGFAALSESANSIRISEEKLDAIEGNLCIVASSQLDRSSIENREHDVILSEAEGSLLKETLLGRRDPSLCSG